MRSPTAELDACLTELSAHGPPDPDDPSTMELIDERMKQLIATPGGAEALVDRYAGDERVAVVRPLAFMLAVAVNERGAAHALAGCVLSMIERLRIDDPWPRLNLCTAVQRLLMFGAITTLDASQVSALARLLHESLAAIAAVRATAATVVADLHYGRHDILPPAELAALRGDVLALVDDADNLTRKEARGLRDFLAEAANA